MRYSFWPVASQSWPDILSLSLKAEALGWDGVWVADHFMPNQVDVDGPVHEAMAMVSALGALVPRVRIGPLVLGNTYRHPAVLANAAVTADHISGGRLILGLGAGWQENEHVAYGLPYYTVGERLKRLDEACVVIRSLMAERRTDLDGRFYHLAAAPLEPKPVNKKIPIMIGGAGEKVTLRIVATHADEWNCWATVDTFKHKSAVLDQHCERLERDPATIARSSAALVYLSDDPAVVRRIREEPQPRQSIAGNAEQLREIIAEYEAAGLDELIVPDFHMTSGCGAEKTEFMQRFIEEVAQR